ncbi:protein lifeguard 1 [Drosophila miranda]|uniref:protein lifeguard 1 n=1 Tax=Drosophila miranda TaxID=7229 RepID=UPI0007E71BA7|nr:protein lifeguard 1 [Drosophila miranda]
MPCFARDNTHDLTYENVFEDKSTRRSFIMKVCLITAFMLLATTAILAIFVTNEDAKSWLFRNFWIVIVALVTTFVILIMCCYCPFLFRKKPINYILLMIYVAGESIIISFISMKYLPSQVLMAIGYTALLVVALALFARFAPCDFTGCGPYLMIILLVMVVMCIVMFFYRSFWLLIIFCSLGILVFSLYLVVDIQMMIGGKHKNQYDEEDYILAALSIYIDIIHLFMYILMLLGILDE